MSPERSIDREEVHETTDDAPPREYQSPLRIFVIIFAVLLVFAGVLWTAQAIGILTAFISGGVPFFDHIVWGVAGLIGLILLLWIIFRA